MTAPRLKHAKRRLEHAKRRSWPRLPLAIPVFVRGVDDRGAAFLEFTTALNVSAGGMLVSLRHAVPRGARVTLEVPAAPLANSRLIESSVRSLSAKAVRSAEGVGGMLYGFRFARPLLSASEGN